jgi:hypothetical protein
MFYQTVHMLACYLDTENLYMLIFRFIPLYISYYLMSYSHLSLLDMFFLKILLVAIFAFVICVILNIYVLIYHFCCCVCITVKFLYCSSNREHLRITFHTILCVASNATWKDGEIIFSLIAAYKTFMLPLKCCGVHSSLAKVEFVGWSTVIIFL